MPPSPASRADTRVIVGIDLGTTNSLVAHCDARGPKVIPDEQGRAMVPSVVRYERNAGAPGGVRTVVGYEAKEAATEHPRTTVSSVKRLMGRSLADAAGDLKYLSYEVVEGEHKTARVRVPMGDGERVVTPQEVSALILRRLKEIAERGLGVPVEQAVVTVPAYFDDAQRQATRDAGRLAGLEVVRIVNEPTAAALAYGLSAERAAARNTAAATGSDYVVVYDLGGGTFDVSVLRLVEGEGARRDAYQVLATAGDTHLGGDDIDHLLVELFTREMAARLGVHTPLELSPQTRKQLVQFAEQVKCRLSERDRAEVRIELGAGDVYERTLTRGELEAISGPLVERTIECCRRAVRDAKLLGADGRPRLATPGEGEPGIGVIVLVGGATRMPLVRRRVAEFFGTEPYTALNPDEVVALGAAVQASILAGSTTTALLLDVIPLSLGIETAGGAVAKLIVRNSAVPARAWEMFSTGVDGQTSIKLHVVQGEREMAADCRSLGEFHLRGIPPMPAGLPQVEVTFLVDANGVLNVSAVERRSGKRATLQVVPNHGLTREEVERIERESVVFAREDMQRHRVVDLIAAAKLDARLIGEQLSRHRPALDPAYAEEISSLMTKVTMLVAAAEFDWRSVNADEFHAAKEALDRASVRLHEIAIAESLRGQSPGT